MTQSKLPETTPEPVRHPDPAADTEPLLHLHKMSTTAGVGTQDYVAVNVTAVVAVVFGLASPLCVFGYLLLIIPIVGVVLSLVALHQIRHSNGTQTGRGIAWTGLILAGGITLGIGGYRALTALHLRSDENAIASLSSQFGQDVASGNYDQAYSLFDAAFQARIPLDQFRSRLKSLQAGGMVPTIKSMSWNGLADFSTNSDGAEKAVTMIIVRYTDTDSDDDAPRMEANFLRDPDGWRIDSLGDIFPPPPEPKAPIDQSRWGDPRPIPVQA